MKKLLALLLTVLMASTMAFAVSAANADALIGTPEIDGVIDDIYLQTGTLTTKAGTNKVWAAGTGEAKSDQQSTTYILYDEDYIYFATEVKESTIVDTKKVPDGWQADAVELWIMYNNTKDKVSVDAYGTAVYGNKAVVPLDDCVFATNIDGDSYVVELAIPVDKYKAGDKISVSMQINDFLEAAATNGAAWGSQAAGDTITLLDEEVVIEEIVEETEAPAEGAPATADITVIAALVSALAAGVVIKKRK